MIQDITTQDITTQDPSQPATQPANPSVKWPEILALTLGGVGLIGAAIAGLSHKLVTNMYETQRVEKIAQRIVLYQFPQVSKGTIGLSIGAESFAVISDRAVNPELRLFVQRSPVDRTERTAEFVREIGATAAWSGTWEDGLKTQTDAFAYCSQETEMETRQGNWLEAGREESVPAIEYRLSAVTQRNEKQYDQNIRILATGPQARQKAESLLRSIQCRV